MPKKKEEAAEKDWRSELVVGTQETPPRVVVYGPHGIGKSTLGSLMPAPIFISTEDGLDNIDTVSFPTAENIEEVADSIRKLIKLPHDFKTAIVDSADWLVEPLITQEVESTHEEKELAYGKGSILVAEAFREILQGLDILRKKHDMNVLLLAHSQVVRFDSPISEPYDRYEPKLPKRCNAILQEWSDVIAFAGFRVMVKKTDVGFNREVSRGITTGERLLHFVETPGYIAKNRYECPDSASMDIETFMDLIPFKS